MKRDTGTVAAIGAVLAAAALIVGVPILLIVLVGNPWPGRTRLELGDEVALFVGVLSVLAWLVWARFVVAVVLEVRLQVAELRLAGRRDPGGPVALSAPPEARQGIGAVAQRLVAAMLVLLPLSAKVAPSTADAPAPLRSEHVATQTIAAADRTPSLPPRDAEERRRPATAPAVAGRVTVGPGDTLIGLARTHLGDEARWRELFELNRDRPQFDGQRLTSPSGLRTGWELTLPAGTVSVEAGDNLWALTEERLVSAGLPAGDADVAAHLQVVIDLNADVLGDPNLIYVGEQIDFPAIDLPAPPPPVEAAPVPTPAPVDVELAPPPPPEPAPPPPVPPPTAPVEVEPAPPTTPPPTTTAVPAPAEADPLEAERAPASPSPIGIGEAALLSAGVLALLAARRRWRLRASQPRARVPEPPPGTVATERRLRAIDAGERLLRLDVAVRAASATLVDGDARIAVVRTGVDGAVELTLTGEATLPPPWEGDGRGWTLAGSTPVELLADAARAVGAPCIALTQLGVDDTGREVFADLEALGLLTIVAPDEQADAVVRGIAATLATSVFADVASLIGVGLDGDAFLDHRRAQHVDAVDEALELATTLVGTTASARQSTFVLRARHTSGEAWEPAIVLAGSSVADQLTPDVATAAGRARGGVAMVAAGEAPGAPWSLRAGPGRWTLEPLGISLVPVGLSAAELHDLHEVLDLGGAPLLDGEADVDHVDHVDPDPAAPALSGLAAAELGRYEDPPWSLLVRLLGPVDVVDGGERPVRFERSKAMELVAWLTLHRERSTRVGARTALWELDVRDATFANIVSEARRAMARHVEPPAGVEWLGRTLTEILPLDERVVADVELLRARLDHARLQPPDLAIETLRPAVELIRDLPFAGTGYLWPDAEGIASNLVLLATSAATELAGHHLSMGDIDGVFWATGQGLKVLPGHEELIALRMRAHAGAGDLSGVRLEWESYERVLSADPWSDGEPAPKLVLLRRELLSS